MSVKKTLNPTDISLTTLPQKRERERERRRQQEEEDIHA